jgi:cell division protein FtsZ
MIEFEKNEDIKPQAPHVTIKVLGVGGAGGNTINSMISAGCSSIQFIAANTDSQALAQSQAELTIQLGMKSTKGLGTGANPDLGKRAAEEDLERVVEALSDADIVFLTGGLGGGTGSGGLPVIAQELKEKGILTIAVVTKPFLFEGKRRMQVAERSLEMLKNSVDTLIVVPNENLLSHVDESVSMIDAFAMINNILYKAVKGISDIISQPGHINVDFADLKAILKDMGLAVIGTGHARGKDRALEAARQATSSPLLENVDISGARSVLLNITGGQNLTLHEISFIASIIYERADQEANIIIGSVIDENLDEEIQVSVLATGFAQGRGTMHQTQQPEQKAVEHEKFASQQTLKQPIVVPEVAYEKTMQVHAKDDLDTPTFLRNQKAETLDLP